jgi:hypothetical protein
VPPPTIPTPARTAIAGAIERARTAPPGDYVVAAVSLKAPEVPDVPTGETPHVPKAKLRAISDIEGGRTYSVAPGQLGYLAPPKAVSDARHKASRAKLVLLLVAIAVAAAGAGVVLALLL